MSYEITYKYNGGPEEKIQLDTFPTTPRDQQLTIQRIKDGEIILAEGASPEDWHERHAYLVEITHIKKM